MRLVERICWTVAFVSIVGGAVIALAMIWTERLAFDEASRLLLTCLVFLLTAGGVLAVNQSIARRSIGDGDAGAPVGAGARLGERREAAVAAADPGAAARAAAPVGIRQARPTDRDAVAALVRDGAGQAAGFVSDAVAEGLADLEVFVAEGDGRILGVIAVRPSGGTRVVDALVVDRDARRRGIGATLLQRTLDRAASMGDRLVVVPVRDDAADAFVRGMGFRPIALPASIGGGVAAIREP